MLQLFEHVLRKLVRVVFADTAVLGCREESTEIEGFLADFRNRQVRAFEDRLQPLKKCVGLLTAFFNRVAKGLKFRCGNIVLLFRVQPRLSIAMLQFELF